MTSVSQSTFAEHLGSTFTIRAGDRAVEATLIEVSGLRANPKGFSLIFRGPAGLHLPQQTYPFEHAALGALAIFIVPVGPDAEGRHRYEAIFN